MMTVWMWFLAPFALVGIVGMVMEFCSPKTRRGALVVLAIALVLASLSATGFRMGW